MTKKRSQVINEYIQKHPPTDLGAYDVIAEKFNISRNAVEHRCRNLGLTLSKNLGGLPYKKKETKKPKTTVEEFAKNVLNGLDKKLFKPFEAIPMPVIKHGKGDVEEEVLFLSDWQLGHRTRSFNLSVAKERVGRLIESAKMITAKERQAHPLKRLHIFLAGDFVQNELVGAFVDLAELEAILIDQVFEHAIPLLSWTISEMAKEYEQVEVHCCRGNHGRGDKMNSERTNWDDVIYNVLAIKFSENPRIKVNTTKDFYSVATIFKWNFLIAHGDQVRGGSYGIPIYALLQRMLRWATSLPEKWNVLCTGHWHCFGYIDQNNQSLLVNGTLVSDDDYVRRRYGWESSTLQLMFGVHPKRPITSMYKIDFKG